MTIGKRKNDHIEICLKENVRSGVSTGFEHWRLVHNAMPEENFDAYSTESVFLGKTIAAPLLISSMTGGTERGNMINRRLLEAAEELHLPFAIGSQRIYLENPELKIPDLRSIAPTSPILANLGAVQLNYGYGKEHCLRAVELIRADALILHLNPLQELLQAGGNHNFAGLLGRIEELCHDFPVPVIIKEVGWGIDPDNARRLTDAGVEMIDVAGAGGTSWSEVERRADGSQDTLRLAEPFADWGIPTADCVAAIHERFPDIRLIASGGITNGVEAAKAIWLGAELCGLAGSLLPMAAADEDGAVQRELRIIMEQYRIARFVSKGIMKD